MEANAVMTEYDPLLLDNQLCFPLYACSKEVVRRYTPVLKEIDLTYTQYLVMMVLWEQGQITVKDLGVRLYLDSGTLTPLLKKMEQKGLIERERSAADERKVIIHITQAGRDLREQALSVPFEVGRCVELELEEAIELRRLLKKVLDSVQAAD